MIHLERQRSNPSRPKLLRYMELAHTWLFDPYSMLPLDPWARSLGNVEEIPEKESNSYGGLAKEVIKHVNSRAPVLSFMAKLLNKLVCEKDWSAQKVSHILLNLPLVSSSLSINQLPFFSY